MINLLPSCTVGEDIIVIDSQFPQAKPLGFRNTEINEYIRRIQNFSAYRMHPLKPGEDAWFSHGYGTTKKDFVSDRQSYSAHYGNKSQQIKYLDPKKRYSVKLAYSFFLAETYVLLPFYDRHNIPFIFVLYPGGGFGVDNVSSDKMLKKIFESKNFRGVIVTQDITKDYLLKNTLCKPEKIHYIYGGFVQFEKNQVKRKLEYPKNKKTVDICFVAAKYSEEGTDKGYDLFIKTAKELIGKASNIRFHVVGGFDKHDIDTSELGESISFYGYMQPDELCDFYACMDIFLAPNRPGQLYEGNFDGFPLGIDAGYCGVALFVADELGMNQTYTDGEDIVIVPLDPKKISKTILHYIENPTEMHILARKCQIKTQQLFDTKMQIDDRIKVFERYTDVNQRA